jgi:hypothetical protein
MEKHIPNHQPAYNNHTCIYLYHYMRSPTRLHPSIILFWARGFHQTSSRSSIWTQIARVLWWFLVTILNIHTYIIIYLVGFRKQQTSRHQPTLPAPPGLDSSDMTMPVIVCAWW